MKLGGQTGVLAGAAALAARAAAWAPDWRSFVAALSPERSRSGGFFLWIPVAAMGGVALNLAADREPALWLPALRSRSRRARSLSRRASAASPSRVCVGARALFAGFSVDGPAHRARRRAGARPHPHRHAARLRRGGRLPARRRALRAAASSTPATCPPSVAPRRVRVTTRKTPDVAAGDFVALKARLLPPSRAVAARRLRFRARRLFPGRRRGRLGARRDRRCGRRPARRRGACGSAPRSTARATGWRSRVDAIIGGDEGAIAAAMVTGKRDFLSNDAKDLIREAGIFHIITISGVQMTLVAGIFFVVARRLLALSPTLALRLSDQEIGGGDRHGRRVALRHRAPARASAPSAR